MRKLNAYIGILKEELDSAFLMTVYNFFISWCDKYLDKSNISELVYSSSQFQTTAYHTKKSQQQEIEVSYYITAMLRNREQEMHAFS